MTSVTSDESNLSATKKPREDGAEKNGKSPHRFRRAMGMLATSEYYDMLGAFAVHIRATFPTSSAGLVRAGVPADFAESIVSKDMRGEVPATVAISLFIEELFELKDFSHPDVLAIRRYCSRKTSDADVEALRLRIRAAIRARWPKETRSNRKRTPWDALYRSYCPQMKPANREYPPCALSAFG